MGFDSGDHGVKRFVCADSILSRATSRDYTVKAALESMCAPYDSTVLILDGNCKAMAVRKDTKTLDEYVAAMLSVVRRAMAAARIVVLCFDQPDLVPPTKRETQARRDSRVAGPDRLAGYPTDATFGVATLEALPDCHPLVENREMRYRLFDEVFARVLAHVRQDVVCIGAYEREPAVLVVDGIDPRGASRPADMPRRPGVHGSNAATVAIVDAAPRTEGEADVHMLAVESRFRNGVELDRLHVSTIVHETVDTDHFGIALRHHANRVNRNLDRIEVIHTYVAMSESSKYAAQELAACTGNPEGSAGILLVNVDVLYCGALTLFAGDGWREAIPQPATRVALVQYLVAVWALGGCDFVDRIGNADLLTQAFVGFVHRMQTSERWSELFKPWFTSADAQQAMPLFRHIVQAAADDPRAARMRTRILSGGDASCLRAAWASAYWGGVEQVVFGAKPSGDGKVLTDIYGDDPPDAPLLVTGRPYDYSRWGFVGVPDGAPVVQSVKRAREDETSPDDDTSLDDEPSEEPLEGLSDEGGEDAPYDSDDDEVLEMEE